MSFQPFQREFADHRVVLIPAGLDDQRRARFVTKIAAAVKQQADLAAGHDGILKVSGEIEQHDDRLLIPHEPAAPGDSTLLEAPPELPDINVVWWLSWSLVQALEAVAPGTPHGGIQIATLYLDQAGRVRLGDFGIAPAFEAVCGSEGRRQVHCDGTVRAADAAGHRCSGVWSLLDEDNAREYGWIAPYFAHELLEGAVRLNPKADQFAAGTLLYLLATGTHPYGASLSDPTLMLYFHLEPFAVRDERSNWAEVFERQDGGFNTAADKPILAWSEFIQKLLDSDPGERFANPAEAKAAAGEHAPATWGEVSAAISAGVKLLDAGEVDAFLEKTALWKDEQALPGLWREQLSRWVADVESRKEEIGAYKRLEQRLAEGQQALNRVEVERARQIAREVLAAPRCDEALRAGAEELVEFCDEQERFIQSGADDLAKAYLESAREYLARNEFDDARHVLNGLLNDPAIPGARAAQARRLVAEVELTEQRLEQQLAELSGAGDDLRAGRYEAARQRLEALLGEEGLPETTATQARELLADVAHAQARRAEYAAALDEARMAWERADLEACERHLAQVPESYAVPEIADVRADLAARCEPLRAALERRAAAEKALAADDVAGTLACVEQAAAVADVPQILRDQFAELAKRCRATIAERKKQRVEWALESFHQAEAACAALRIDECCRRLKEDVIGQAGLPEDVVARADELLRTCARVEQAQTLFEHVRQHLADADFQDATVLLDGLKPEGLPPRAVAELDRLRAEVARAREEHARREQQKLAVRLDEIDAATDAGQVDDAEATLREVETSPHLTDRLRRRASAARSTIAEQRRLLETIAAAEDALSADPSVLAASLAELDRLPEELPAWATARIESVKQRAAQLAEQRRREALRRATAALDATQAALDAGDVATGRSQLDQAREGLDLDPVLAERHEQLSVRAAHLDEWWPKVQTAEQTVAGGDLLAAHRELGDLLRDESIPEPCRAQLVALREQAESRIAARQQQVDAQLVALTTELGRRGRRARNFRERVGALKTDPLATEQHHARADELLAQHEQLPEPKPSKAPLAIAGSVAVVALICVGLYFGGVLGSGGGMHQPPPSPRVRTDSQPSGPRPDLQRSGPRPDLQRSGPRPRAAAAEPSAPTSNVAARALARPPPQQPPVAEKPPSQQPAVPEENAGDQSEPRSVSERTVPAPDRAREKAATLAHVWQAYLDELRAALPDVVVDEQLSPLEDGSLELNTQWRERGLHPFSGLRFDEQEASFNVPVASVAAYFRVQIEALAALGQPLKITVPPGQDEPACEATLQVTEPLRDVLLAHVDRQARSVQVKTAVRLEGDPRSAAGFAFSAAYAGGKFSVDAATRSAFNVYLRGLQQHQLGDSLRRIEQQLRLPAGVRLDGPGEFAGGARLTLSVDGAGDEVFATLDAEWNSQTLLYEIGVEDALAALRTGLRAAAENEATRAALAAGWAEVRSTLAPAADQPGVKYFGRCGLLELALRDEQPPGPFAVAVELAIGPQGAGADERIRFPARLRVQEGMLAWDPDAAGEAKATIVARLQALAGDADFRARRRGETLVQLAGELGVTRSAMSLQAEGDRLVADVTVAGGRRIFTWTWDRAALRYANRVESAPPAAAARGRGPLRLDDKLRQLASQPTADVRAFRGVLAEITQAKIERYGTTGYALAEGFAGAGSPADGLLAVSAGLQKLIAPNVAARAPARQNVAARALARPLPTRDPFPVVFIDYFLGRTDVYALSWQALTDDHDAIIGVSDAQVWRVMSVDELRSYPRPAAFRQDYSSDVELGERLLGRAFGDVLEGSAKPGGGSFGVVVAPDGPLWLTRWEQVRFNPRPVKNVDLRGAEDPGRVSTLRALLKPARLGAGKLAWRRAGLWCVPALAGEWRGPADRIERFQLGLLADQQKPGVANFKWRRGPLVFASVADSSVRGADFRWPEFARSVAPEALGYRFWDRGWPEGAGQWEATPFTSFALLQIP